MADLDRVDQRGRGKVVEAVFENGVIKPLEALDLEGHQRLRIVITPHAAVVTETQALITADPELVEEVAKSDEYLPS